MRNNKSKERGITLVVLVVTIIVLLILAGVTLNGIFDESGIINNAQKAKENSEIAEEKEIVQMANIFANQVSSTGDITSSDIENAINEVGYEKNTTVMDDADFIVIRFNESNRNYTIDKNGYVQGPIKGTDDKYAGDISKGGQYTGTEEKPFVINCIEDLVAFSIMTNGENEELGLASNTFSNKYVVLKRTLDFNSIFSYKDFTSKEYGDLNGDGTVEDIKTELTKQGDNCGGFTPIGLSDTSPFQGIFDGQNNKICNLYENRTEGFTGLFGMVKQGTIQNLGLESITLSGVDTIGGIVAFSQSGKILNCFVEGTSKITSLGAQKIGLIVGFSRSLISGCYSKGELEFSNTTSDGYFGGIAGRHEGEYLEKSYNIMNIKGVDGMATAGIVAATGSGVTIKECYHIGDIESGWKAAGIGRW